MESASGDLSQAFSPICATCQGQRLRFKLSSTETFLAVLFAVTIAATPFSGLGIPSRTPFVLAAASANLVCSEIKQVCCMNQKRLLFHAL
jgi:hypothetical protein